MMTSLMPRRGEELVWGGLGRESNRVVPFHCNCKGSVLILFLQKKCTICSLFLLHSHAYACVRAFPEVWYWKIVRTYTLCLYYIGIHDVRLCTNRPAACTFPTYLFHPV